jgi:demethylmenaquinone methyltransferase/2-methoxy-6-polyprenyl-1,4-benzoquinol methylase
MPVDASRSVADYRTLAADYDRRTRLINAIRLEAVAALELRPGDTVLDVACGSGFSFASIIDAVGKTGRLLAFDHSAELLSIARTRTGQNNIAVIEAGAESVALPARPNALLFSYTHDVLQSRTALDNLLSQATPGARVALCGSVLWPAAAWPLSTAVNAWLRARHRRFIADMENFDRPWAKIEPRLRDFRVVRRGPGWRYLASGTLR